MSLEQFNVLFRRRLAVVNLSFFNAAAVKSGDPSDLSGYIRLISGCSTNLSIE
jgi:hypothetical protein